MWTLGDCDLGQRTGVQEGVQGLQGSMGGGEDSDLEERCRKGFRVWEGDVTWDRSTGIWNVKGAEDWGAVWEGIVTWGTVETSG